MAKKSSNKGWNGLSKKTFFTVLTFSFVAVLVTSAIKVSSYSAVQTAYGKEGSGEDNSGSNSGSGNSGSTEDKKHEEEKKSEENKGSTDNNNNSSGSGSEGSIINTVKSLFVPSPTLKKTSNREKEDSDKEETEVRINETERIKTKTEEGKSEVEIRQGNVKLKFKYEDGKLVAKTENEKGEEVEANKNEVKHVESELEDEGVEIASGSAGRIRFEKNNVPALSDFPLSVTDANKLVVTTPAGDKEVTVLPDQALQRLLAVGLINQINSATNSSSLNSTQTGKEIKLAVRNNTLVYEIEGTKDLKLFGVVPVSVDTTAFISAEDGSVVGQQRSLLANIFSFFSR